MLHDIIEVLSVESVASDAVEATRVENHNNKENIESVSAQNNSLNGFLNITESDNVLFHVSPLNERMPQLFDALLASSCSLLIPERSSNMKDLARLIAENEVNLVVIESKDWRELSDKLNFEQPSVQRMRLILLDDGGTFVQRFGLMLRSLSAEKGNDPYAAYRLARGVR
ncbi:MAG: hypothetical protein ACRBF0_19295 [Calditrichia bacterium]